MYILIFTCNSLILFLILFANVHIYQQFQLASLYISGEGGEQNFQKAHAHMMV